MQSRMRRLLYKMVKRGPAKHIIAEGTGALPLAAV